MATFASLHYFTGPSIDKLDSYRLAGYRLIKQIPGIEDKMGLVLVNHENPEALADQIKSGAPLVYLSRRTSLVDWENGSLATKGKGLVERVISTHGLREIVFSEETV